jgi:hypothetical protein
MKAEAQQNLWSRLVLGLIILAAGIVFWLDQMDRADARAFLQWWPLAAIVFGLAHLLERKWSAGIVWILVGGFFLAPIAGFERPSLWLLLAVWPLLISVAGMTLILQAFGTAERARKGSPGFSAVAVMAGNVRRVTVPTAGGQVIAVMGGCEIQIAATALLEREIVIDVLAFWGGIEISVPRGWQVISHVAPILGGVELKGRQGREDAPRLVLRGSAIMGGVEVRHASESE